MKLNQAYRYELAPNNKQIGLLFRCCGVARFTYNWGLAQRIALFDQNEGKDKFTNAIAQSRQLNALKKTEFPWMYQVSKCAPQKALRNLDRAFTNFWRGRKSGKHVGFPKFKKKGIHDSFELTGAIHVFDNSIQLPRLGKIRTKEDTAKFDGRILSATVSREADRWFVSLAVERDRVIPLRTDSDVAGVDLGINSFAVTYDGKNTGHIYAPKPLNKKLKRLRRLSRCYSRKQRGSNNKRKSALRLAKLHRHIKNTRTDF
jgi:putative transposase